MKIFSIHKESSRLDALRQNIVYYILTAPFLLLPYLRPSQRLPDICVFKRITNHPCIFCGYTRAFENLAYGHYKEAFTDCPAAVLVYLTMGFVLILSIILTAQKRTIQINPSDISPRLKRILLFGTGLILMTNWIYRLLCC